MKRHEGLRALAVFSAVLCGLLLLISGCDTGDVINEIIEVVECDVPPPFCEDDCPDCTDDELEELLALHDPVAPEPATGFVAR